MDQIKGEVIKCNILIIITLHIHSWFNHPIFFSGRFTQARELSAQRKRHCKAHHPGPHCRRRRGGHSGHWSGRQRRWWVMDSIQGWLSCFNMLIQGDPSLRGPGLGWLRFGMFHRPLGCTAAAVLPKQDSGTSQIEVNPTQVREEMGHPVVTLGYNLQIQCLS